MTVQVFPTTLTAAYPIRIKTGYKTTITDYGEGAVQRVSNWRFGKRTIVVPYGKMPVGDRDTLLAFFRARMGSGESFWYVHNRQEQWTDEYVGYGTAGALTLDLHCKATVVSSLVIYEDGVAQVKDTDFTFVSGGGAADADRITWIAGHYPAAGALITADHRGLLRILAYFSDEIDLEWFRFLHSKSEVTLFEEQW